MKNPLVVDAKVIDAAIPRCVRPLTPARVDTLNARQIKTRNSAFPCDTSTKHGQQAVFAAQPQSLP